MPDDDDSYLVWSNEHRGWWRAAGKRGYATGLRGAGRFSREAALSICRGAILQSAHVGSISEVPVRAADVNEFLSAQLIPDAILEGEAPWTND
jgi:hypothetical protein